MTGVRISALPSVGSPALTDIFPEVQPASGGTTYKVTFQQLLNLFEPNITTLGAITANSLNFTSTSGIIGTTTNNNAAAGSVGEFITSNIPLGSAISLTNNTAANVTSISLTAGDWDINGNVFFTLGTPLAANIFAWTSLVSASGPDNSEVNSISASTLSTSGISTPFLRVSIASTTTVYLCCVALFGSSTITACGSIFARRVR